MHTYKINRKNKHIIKKQVLKNSFAKKKKQDIKSCFFFIISKKINYSTVTDFAKFLG